VTNYFPNSGRIASAHHPRTGTVVPGDRVTCGVAAGRVEGVVQYLVRGNGGKGRPFASVLWDDGTTTTEPLGRMRRA
jgi:hypothetical protein